ncbi:hypothetical protein G7A66_00625 [Altererythrobacter sp. SALINAS58]|uniref:hypothetical protein n=1 Tax=Alteripontixanthobacter muriae TaxID=2705546 RepID=UPI0015765DDE|nr:hypothetical protein [Alteripontixanthobacter muriae]NTZ41617.1 hypothetical protein [Alteripontixanthobacter muriae]
MAIIDGEKRLYSLRSSGGSYAGDNLQQTAGTSAGVLPLEDHKGSACNANFCSTIIDLQGASYGLLIARNADALPDDVLRRSCATADIVVSERVLGPSCNPRWLKLDRYKLNATGGLSIYLDEKKLFRSRRGRAIMAGGGAPE